jgi:hypothetical protein
MKRDASTRPFLLCEVRDPVLALDGDSGAIGRFSVGPDQLYLDIKGARRGLLMSSYFELS